MKNNIIISVLLLTIVLASLMLTYMQGGIYRINTSVGITMYEANGSDNVVNENDKPSVLQFAVSARGSQPSYYCLVDTNKVMYITSGIGEREKDTAYIYRCNNEETESITLTDEQFKSLVVLAEKLRRESKPCSMDNSEGIVVYDGIYIGIFYGGRFYNYDICWLMYNAEKSELDNKFHEGYAENPGRTFGEKWDNFLKTADGRRYKKLSKKSESVKQCIYDIYEYVNEIAGVR